MNPALGEGVQQPPSGWSPTVFQGATYLLNYSIPIKTTE